MLLKCSHALSFKIPCINLFKIRLFVSQTVVDINKRFQRTIFEKQLFNEWAHSIYSYYKLQIGEMRVEKLIVSTITRAFLFHVHCNVFYYLLVCVMLTFLTISSNHFYSFSFVFFFFRSNLFSFSSISYLHDFNVFFFFFYVFLAINELAAN